MSGLAGLLALDGGSAETLVLQRMLAALAHRGRDGQNTWSSGPIAMGHQAFWTTPEARGEIQPWRHPSGELVATLDGRIDNRRALRDALVARGLPPRAEHDAELVLRAYECWGEDFARELVGDFAVAIWDGPARRLVCARDPLGVKPFYYHFDGHHFRWSSEPQAIFEDPTVPRRPHEGMVAEMLAGYLVSTEETLWQGLFRLRPGHTLTVTRDGLCLRRYWSPESAPGELRGTGAPISRLSRLSERDGLEPGSDAARRQQRLPRHADGSLGQCVPRGLHRASGRSPPELSARRDPAVRARVGTAPGRHELGIGGLQWRRASPRARQ